MFWEIEVRYQVAVNRSSMAATLKAQKTISSWQINTASYDGIDIIKYHYVLQGMLTKKGVVFHLAGKNKYTWAFKHQQNTGSIYEFCRISQVHFGNPSWSIIRTIRYLLDITFRSSPMMHFMYSPKSSRYTITVWTVHSSARSGWITKSEGDVATCPLLPLTNIRGLLIFSVLTPQARHDTRGGESEHNACSLMEGCFCQGVGWLRLDKRDVCCLGPNLSHQESLKASQRAAYVYILDPWLSLWFYICLDAPMHSQAVRDLLSLQVIKSWDLKVPFSICFYVGL